jgi:organic radical activating enzyme
MKKNIELTQKYSTWGDKLLQHTDVLYSIQSNKIFKPITIQLAPTEFCNSHCSFCSVMNRPKNSYISFSKIKEIIESFKKLGAKSLEITGGGNPLLYYDRVERKDINDIIEFASEKEFDIGIITNHYSLKKLNKQLFNKINWIRVSLIMLDEGKSPIDYDFNEFPISKLGFSYIIYNESSVASIKKIQELVELYPDIKFVRIAGNCLIKGNNAAIEAKYASIINEIDKTEKFFIKDIGTDDSPFNEGCYMGAIRPYIAPSPNGLDYQVYVCTSYVLNKQNYDLDYSLGSCDAIEKIWGNMNECYRTNGYLYDIKNNKGSNWLDTCKYCFYKFNNKLLHSVSNEMPDKNFP